MTQTLNSSFQSSTDDERISRGLRWSVIVHLALFTALLLKSLIFPGEPIRIVPTLRVDIVGLPDILKKDMPITAPAPGFTPESANRFDPKVKELKEVAKPDEMVLKPKKQKPEAEKPEKKNKRDKKLKSAIDRIKSLNKIQSALDKIKPQAAGPLIKGNKISPGTSLSGEAREAAQASYYDLVRDQLQAHWALPVWLARQNFSAQVRIYLDARGKVRNVSWIKTSGSPQFDQSVQQTIAESQPFPVPPAELLDSVSSSGVVVGFPL